jgi:CSLREA domain-containing protein
VATGLLTVSGLGLTALPADGATGHHTPAVAGAATGKPLSSTKLAQVRARQQQMLARHTSAPTFAKAASKTFTVNTTEDSDLANPAGKTCVDAATSKCSLRAAVNAANNLATPVRILLKAHTYTLSSATSLNVTNPQGTSIVGKGSGKTTIRGAGSGVFYEYTASGASPALLFLSDAKVAGGSASYGGGFYLSSSTSGVTLVLDHVVVSGNTASSYGGGLYADDYDTLYASNTRFANNVSPTGAGIYTYWSDINLTQVSMTGNHSPAASTGYGGAIYNDYGVLRIRGGSLSGNTVGDRSAAGYGGGIYDAYGNVSLTGVHVDDNTANGSGNGGGLSVYYDLVEVNGGTVSHNHATGQYSRGGGVYEDSGAQLDLHGVTMAGNRVGNPNAEAYGGGALFLYGYEYGNQTTIDRGSKISGSNGSAVYAYADEGQIDLSVADSTMSGNHNTADNGMDSYGCGGAICAYNYEYGAVNLSMTGNKIMNNSSTGNEGSGAVSVFAYDYGGASVSLRGNRFEKNVAGAGGYGGALVFYNDDDYSPISVRSQSNTFVKNRAGTSGSDGFGGAMALYYYANLTDKGSTFTKNVAVGDSASGGAVGDASYQTARFTGTTFTGNRAGPSGTGNGYGGAVYSEAEGGLAFTQVTMSGNRATSYGGGFYSEDAYSTSFTKSTISGNTAGTSSTAGYGGGIYAYDAVLVLENSTVANNSARSISGTPGQGGGLYLYDGSTTGVRYSTVSGNVAKQGGGVYAYSYGGNLLGSIVSQNRATKGGAEQDCTTAAASARLHSLGGNVLGQKSCVTATGSGDKVSKKPGLGKLKNNGGPTRTMALSKKSPAIGRSSFQVPSTDQRGHGRPSKHADAGAYERPKK